MALPPHFQAIEKHLDQFFDSKDEIVVFDEKESPDFHLDAYWIKPNDFRNYHILLTNGVSTRPLKTPSKEFSSYIELAILLPKYWNLGNEQWKAESNYWPISLLKGIGRYPHENNTWLGFGHTIPEAENETISGTKFTATILLKSKTLPPAFQTIPYENNAIEIFLLFPLYKNELTYKTQKGTDSLIDLFQRNNINDIIDINRKNVCV